MACKTVTPSGKLNSSPAKQPPERSSRLRSAKSLYMNQGECVIILIGPEGRPKLKTAKSDDGYVADDGYVEDSGYEYDYQERYFEPANEEEALVMQLSTKLAITEILRESLE